MIWQRDETKERGESIPLALPEFVAPCGNTIRGGVGDIDAPTLSFRSPTKS